MIKIMIRTRFAPSPTGYIHLGNVRSAIYPYLIAKQSGGKFILRIEDTDRARYVADATDLIMDTLRWLGLDWDEGPEVGGPNAPYYQTERKSLYHAWAKRLIEKNRAYVDPTPPETIAEYRKTDTTFLYRHHRPDTYNLSPEETLKRFKEGGVPLRFKSDPKNYTWTDEVMGEMKSGPEVLDDIVLIKADGLPTYNFAHIVDDAEMNVTHIARGVEYLSSTPNYLALYEALEIDHPKFLSLPHILAPTGNKKLGKRDGAKSVTEYRADGIPKEALLNYLACLGWNDGTEQEIYSKDELLKSFSIDRIQSSPARFDENKILWYSGQWIRKIADEQGIDELYARTMSLDTPTTNTPSANASNPKSAPEVTNPNAAKTATTFWPATASAYPADYQKSVLGIIYDRLKTLSDLKTMTTYFFEEPEIDLDLILKNKFLKKFSERELADLLETSADKLGEIDSWTADKIQSALNALLEKTSRKPAELFSLIRLALSYAPFSPALNLTMNVLGKDRSLTRLRATISALTNDYS